MGSQPLSRCYCEDVQFQAWSEGGPLARQPLRQGRARRAGKQEAAAVNVAGVLQALRICGRDGRPVSRPSAQTDP
jgi:hypothetical protein